MSDVDTSAEAASRLAVELDSIDSALSKEAAATLRALAEERDQWRANSRENKMIAEANLRDRDRLAAENENLRAALEEIRKVRGGTHLNPRDMAETMRGIAIVALAGDTP